MKLKNAAAAVVTLGAGLSVIVAGLFVGASSAQAASRAYLFTVQAVSGQTETLAPSSASSLSSSSGSASAPSASGTSVRPDEAFTLTLRGVDPVTKFTDRPFRNAAVMSPAALVSNWDSWFARSAPNAVLTYARGSGVAPSSIVVTLSHPRYTASGRSLSFTATRTYRAVDPLQKGSNWVRPVTPRTFVSASLFIDDAGSSSTDSLVASLQDAMQPYVFAPNNAQTWAAVTAAMSAILTTAWQQGTLMGPTASSAFTVSCQLMSTQQILNGYMTCPVTFQLMGGGFYSTVLTQQMATSG